VHHIPVMDGDEIAGIITTLAVQGQDPQTPVSTVYTPDPYVVELSTALESVLRDMASRHVGSAIVTREGRLAGVFTWGDACLAFAEFLDEMYPPPGGDEAA
jgi:predicted transcriptional regulator